MDMIEDIRTQKTTVTLFRCMCKECDVTEEELKRLTEHYGGELKVNYVEEMPWLKKLAGWRTPLIYVNGKLDIKHWEKVIQLRRQAVRNDCRGYL